VASAEGCVNAALRVGPSALLPDCRAYEQVSPVEKTGVDAIPTGTTVFPAEAAPGGGEIAYMSAGSLAGAAANELPNAYISARTTNGWQTQSLTPPTPQATPPGGTLLGYDFSSDLSQVVIKVPLQTLTPGAPTGVYNLYLRHPDGSYSLVTSAQPSVSLPANCGFCFNTTDVAAFAGASEDFSHILFEANEALTAGAPVGGAENLYESADGQINLVGMLPDGTIAAAGAKPGAGISVVTSAVIRSASQDVEHAISADGSHVLFSAAADAGGPDPAQSGLTELYDRIHDPNTGQFSTIEISAQAPAASPVNPAPEPAQFRGAAADGSLVYFTSAAELTSTSDTGSENSGQDLYQYNVATGTLTDLTVDSNAGDQASGADVLGVSAVSTNGDYVYFVATGQLPPDLGLPQQPNLYVYEPVPGHPGLHKTEFIATLNESDTSDWTSTPANLRAYATPDGQHFAFSSFNSLTPGYDNTDQSTGEADREVYEYSAATGQLACASCDPSGARPLGNAFLGATPGQTLNTPFYQPQVLSDDGSRLFFSSYDPLVAGSAGSHAKVFEYEAGQVYPISAGASSTDDIFLDASADGNDVYFATREQLTPSDQDEYADVYDARVEGGFPSPSVTAPCATSECQSSTDPGFPLATPVSSLFVGPGNLPASDPTTHPPAKKAKKPKPKKSKKKKKKRTKAKAKKGRQKKRQPTHPKRTKPSVRAKQSPRRVR
jgi:hypothetical protein